MTVRQLKEALSKFPDSMEVFMADRKTEFKYGLLNSVYPKLINFSEDPEGDPMANDDVLILDEE